MMEFVRAVTTNSTVSSLQLIDYLLNPKADVNTMIEAFLRIISENGEKSDRGAFRFLK